MRVIERDLHDFEQFVMDCVEEQSETLDLEDYVCLWRARREREDTTAAIQEGFDDLAAGRVRSAADVMAELRQRLV